MARMHSRKKGVSGSTRPSTVTKHGWIGYKPREVELLIHKFAKEGRSASEIGIILRDQYGIPSIKELIGKTITAALEEKQLAPQIPEDMMALIRKAVLVRKHLEQNHHDETAHRGLILTESKINRLAKYYRGTGRIPSGWKYDPAKVRVLVG